MEHVVCTKQQRAARDVSGSHRTRSTRIGFALVAALGLGLTACGGSASETPPPLEPQPEDLQPGSGELQSVPTEQGAEPGGASGVGAAGSTSSGGAGVSNGELTGSGGAASESPP